MIITDDSHIVDRPSVRIVCTFHKFIYT